MDKKWLIVKRGWLLAEWSNLILKRRAVIKACLFYLKTRDQELRGLKGLIRLKKIKKKEKKQHKNKQ